MHRKALAPLLALALLLSACGGDGDTGGSEAEPSAGDAASQFEQTYDDVEAYPVFVSNELVAGPNRFVVGLLDDQDAPLADPAIQMDVTFFDISGAEPEEITSTQMEWLWIEKPLRGYYIGNVELPEPGELGIEVKLDGGGIDEELRAKGNVVAESTTPDYGEDPPASDSLTLDDGDIKDISSDTTPVRSFYESTIAEALKSGQPSVVIFATPKFCQSAVCAPTLDNVQSVSGEFPNVTFVHVEPYELDKLPEQLVPVKAMTEWKLPTEPWVFVMDADGKVAAKYEGVMAPDELRSVLEELS